MSVISAGELTLDNLRGEEPGLFASQVAELTEPQSTRAVKTQRSPLRIVFLSHYFPPEGNAPASRVYEMAKRWVRDGYDVTVITSAPNCPDGILYAGYKNKLFQREEIDGIHVIRVWTYLAANKGKLRRGLNFISYMITATLAALWVKRPDILIATSPQFFCGWAGTIVSMLRRLPFLLEIRDIWPESIAAVGAMKKRLPLRILEAMEKIMYRSATHLVTVGDGYRLQLSRRGVDPARVSVVTNGVDRELFTQTADGQSVRARHGLNDDFVCAFVGTLGMASALRVVIRAGKILKAKGRDDVKFMLVGDGALRAQLEDEVNSENLDNIIFTGRLDKRDVPAHLACADACMVHLRKHELFKTVLPSKMFEAAAMGKPILLGVEGCAADFLNRAGAGIAFEPENADALVAAIETLAGDRALAQKLGADGRRYVLRHFDRDQLSRDYLDVLHQTAAAEEELDEVSVCA